MITSRILVVSTSAWARRAAAAAAADFGCEVVTADGPDCVAQVRMLGPDLVVLAPPVPWATTADAVDALAATAPQIPVLVLPRPTEVGSAFAVPVLVAARRASRPATLPPLVDRVCRWSKGRSPASAAG